MNNTVKLPYIENGEIKVFKLIKGIKDELLAIKAKIVYNLEKNEKHWQDLKNHIASLEEGERENLKTVWAQIEHLEHYIDTLVQMSVANESAFKMFVATKAAEIKSGDELKDYFWSLSIRYDQLLASVTVLKMVVINMEKWKSLDVADIIDEPVFLGLIDFPIEKQIYMQAEEISKQKKV